MSNTEGAEVPENITDYKNLFDLWLATKKQNAALKKALADLLPIVEFEIERHLAYKKLFLGGTLYEVYKEKYDRAKTLLNPDPENEGYTENFKRY